MWLLVGMTAVSLLVLVLAAGELVAGASRIAVRLRVAPIVVGVVIIGFGTSTPEFLAAGLAAAQGEVALGLASLVGSNIANITLLLGIAALIAPVAVASSTVRREAPLSVAAVTLFALAVLLGLGLAAGVLLAAAAVVTMVWLVRVARRAAEPVPRTVRTLLEPSRRLAVEITRLAVGLLGTVAGAHLLVVSAADLALELGVGTELIGYTVVAVGTSLPELVTAVHAQLRREPDLLVGNLLGSNLFNSLAGGAAAAFGAGVDPQFHLAAGLLAAMVAISVLAWLLLWKGYRASRRDGVLLLAVYAACLPLLW